MKKTNFVSMEISGNHAFKVKSVTSLSISNHGDTDLHVFGRVIPAISGVNPSRFVIDSDGTETDMDFPLKFDTGKGRAYIDYKCLVEPNNC
ncbi:hypothetical protein [Flavobacterium sp. CAU 1735]|uniref:hypothetical protein n=1 Tax=Flavobacterium sp. CAU 1735 TaxID=3140361 RepID=UPI0032618E99